MRLKLRIWRQAGPTAAGRLEDYMADDVSPDMSFLGMLDVVNEGLVRKGQDAIAFDSDCREGICGSCGLMVNGVPHGPEPGGTVCQLHMRRFRDGETITIFGDGLQLRDFTYVDDAVEAFLMVGANDATNGQVFNIGAMEPVSLRELAELLIEVCGSGRFQLIPFPPPWPGVVRAAGRVGEASRVAGDDAEGDGEAGRGARGVGAAASAGATRKASERRDAPTAMGWRILLQALRTAPGISSQTDRAGSHT